MVKRQLQGLTNRFLFDHFALQMTGVYAGVCAVCVRCVCILCSAGLVLLTCGPAKCTLVESQVVGHTANCRQCHQRWCASHQANLFACKPSNASEQGTQCAGRTCAAART